MADREIDTARTRLEDRETGEPVLQHGLARAERAYDRVLTTLWIGNAGGALTTLLYATANRHDGTFTRSLLAPLILFVLGLALTGIGSLIEFESERRALTRLARGAAIANDRPAFGGWRPHWRTVTALLSGACFSIGFIFGFAMLARN